MFFFVIDINHLLTAQRTKFLPWWTFFNMFEQSFIGNFLFFQITSLNLAANFGLMEKCEQFSIYLLVLSLDSTAWTLIIVGEPILLALKTCKLVTFWALIGIY